MFIYQILLLIGAIGFAAMVGLGFIHTGHGDAHGHHGHGLDGGHGHGHAGHTGHGSIDSVGQHHAPIGAHVKSIPMGAKHGGHHSGHGRFGGAARLKSVFMISPVDIFSMALGAGATGLLLKDLVNAAILPWLAVLGALVFCYGIVRPIFAAAFKFASKPSEGLEGAVAHTGQAVTRFDGQGRGLVQLILDGEAKQLLAKLDSDDLSAGVQVQKGDELLVLEVDSQKNTCRVTRV